MKKVLLIGTSFSAVPIYFALKNRGFHVTVCGDVKTDPCHQYADNSLYIDYSNPEALYDEVEKSDFDFLVPSCNDYSYLSASKVANSLGFPGFDTNETTAILHTKKLFRERTAKFNLRAPKTISDLSYDLPFPYLIKPVDSYSGRGVTLVNSVEEISEAIKVATEASRTGEFIIEEYVRGTLHSCSAFISKNKIYTDFFVDEYCTTYPYQVNCSNHPSLISDEIKFAVRLEIERLANELDIIDGLLHTQFISDGENFWIIECMRRCPGDLYGSLIERSTGVKYTDLFIIPFIECEYSNKLKNQHEYFYGRHTISSDNPLVNFSFSSKFDQINLEVIQLKRSGEILNTAPFDKLAIILTKFKDKQSMALIVPKFIDFIEINSIK
jgi:predicted ATP-grasp superfamily ATP-dependent carboligase